MRVKPSHQSISSSTWRSGQQIYFQPEGLDKKKKKTKQNKNPTSSSRGVHHRRHLFRRHILVEEDNRSKVEEIRFGSRSKATCQKRRPEELTEKILSTATMKGEKAKSFLLLKFFLVLFRKREKNPREKAEPQEWN